MKILVFGEYDKNNLSPALVNIVFAARELGENIDILIAGKNVQTIAEQAAKIDGVRQILLAQSEVFARPFADTLSQLLFELAPNYDAIIASTGSIGRNIMPRLAAKLDIAPISDVIKIEGRNKFSRPIYAGNAIETITNEQEKIILTIRASAFDKVAKNNNAKIKEISFGKIEPKVKFLREMRSKNDGERPDLSSAAIVIGGGRGLQNKENFKMIEELADILGAGIGATRAAVDAELAPNDWQIGQTGKIIAPHLYIGIGVSGALQHLAGISGAKTIIAINSDSEAPLVKIADYAIIGDLSEIVPKLIKILQNESPKQNG